MIAGRAGLLAHAQRGRKHDHPRSLVYKDWNPPFPSWVLSNLSTVRDRAAQFDGFTFRSTNASGSSSPNTSFTLSALQSEFSGWGTADFGNITRNWFTVRTTNRRAEWDSDSDWTQLNTNFSRIAEFVGSTDNMIAIAWDNEYYSGGADPPTNQWANGTTLSDADCAAVAYQRGQDLMAAMVAAWPAVRIWMAYGGWYGHQATAEWLHPDPPFNTGVPQHNRMMWPFWCGMVKGTVGTSARLSDGGELYAIRNGYEAQRAWFGLSAMPPRLKTGVWVQPTGATYWPGDLTDLEFRNVPVVGLYDREDPLIGSGFTALSAAQVEANVRNTLRTHEFVWAYCEEYAYIEPTNRPAAPQSYLDAMAEGRRTGRW